MSVLTGFGQANPPVLDMQAAGDELEFALHYLPYFAGEEHYMPPSKRFRS